MIRMLRAYRINGDCISCRFSPEGALATAQLQVGQERHNVAGQLPGITSETSKEYLATLGYRVWVDPATARIARGLCPSLEAEGLLCESVDRSGDRMNISVIRTSERNLAVPRRVAMIRFDVFKDSLEVIFTSDQSLSDAAVRAMHGTGRS